MTLYLLEYQLAEDYLERREEYRDAHLGRLRQAANRGTLVLAGPLSRPSDRSLLVWREERAAQEFVDRDPYVAAGLVLAYQIREWQAVVGSAVPG